MALSQQKNNSRNRKRWHIHALFALFSFSIVWDDAYATTKSNLSILAPAGYVSPDITSFFEKQESLRVVVHEYHSAFMLEHLMSQNHENNHYDLVIMTEKNASDYSLKKSFKPLPGSMVNYRNGSRKLPENTIHLSYDPYGLAILSKGLPVIGSWSDFYSLDEKDKNKILIQSDYGITIDSAMLALNQSVDFASQKNLSAAAKTLMNFKQKNQPYFSENPIALSSQIDNLSAALVSLSNYVKLKNNTSNAIKFIFPGNKSIVENYFAGVFLNANHSTTAIEFLTLLKSDHGQMMQVKHNKQASTNDQVTKKWLLENSDENWSNLYLESNVDCIPSNNSSVFIDTRKSYYFDRIVHEKNI